MHSLARLRGHRDDVLEKRAIERLTEVTLRCARESAIRVVVGRASFGT